MLNYNNYSIQITDNFSFNIIAPMVTNRKMKLMVTLYLKIYMNGFLCLQETLFKSYHFDEFYPYSEVPSNSMVCKNSLHVIV